MTMVESGGKALLEGPSRTEDPKTSQIVEVARKHGVSPFRQLREMLTLRFSRAKLEFGEYYACGAFDPAIPMERKKDFVGETSSRLINDRLSPLKLSVNRGFIRDKVLYTALVSQMGFRTTHTQAVVHATRGFGDLITLRTVERVRKFLVETAKYPLFGKPCEGCGSIGSALILGVDSDAETLSLGNGREIDLGKFCEEVVRDYPEGFIFQDALGQDPKIEAVTGKAVGTVRVVTLRDTETPRVFYSVWKLPSPAAMSDNFWQAGSMIAALDSDTGQIQKVRRGTGLEAEWIEKHPVSGIKFEGFRIPYWDKVRVLTERAHALFPEFGVIGWDIGITPDGPAIVEANPNPLHALWQVANGRGFNNPEFAPPLDAASDLSSKIHKESVALHNARLLSKKRKG